MSDKEITSIINTVREIPHDIRNDVLNYVSGFTTNIIMNDKKCHLLLMR
ncbi:MAG: hypothetical protein H6925_05020 [Holosporaceae bacterium]|nr:MAG: hypothetical protein H6925_05020 [Holosporaceae bacterium]